MRWPVLGGLVLPSLVPRRCVMAADPNKPDDQHDDDVAVERRIRSRTPRRFRVLLHNDNYTTMEFVVEVLIQFFNKDPAEAEHIMLTVHHKGHGVAGIYGRDVAETKVAQVTRYAQDHGMPLKLSAEPE